MEGSDGSSGDFGSLSIFPLELLDRIMGWARESLKDFLACSSVSRGFRDLISRNLSVIATNGHVLRTEFLHRYGSIREVRGPVLLSSLWELEDISGRLAGDLHLLLPGAERKQENYTNVPGLLDLLKTSSMSGIRRSEDRNEFLESMMCQVLRMVRERIRKYPRHRVVVQICGVLRVRYYRGSCVLRIPVGISSSFRSIHRRDSNAIARSLQHFFQVVPITHLLYLTFVINDTERPSKESQISPVTSWEISPVTSWEFSVCLLESTAATTLRSVGVDPRFPEFLISHISESRRGSLSRCLPKLRSLRVCHPGKEHVASHTWDIRKMDHVLKTLEIVTSQVPHVTAIEGHAYLVPKAIETPDVSDPETFIPFALYDFTKHFSQIRSWNVLFECSKDDTSEPRPLHISSKEELRGFLTNKLTHNGFPPSYVSGAVARYCHFWRYYSTVQKLDLHPWYRG